MDINKAILSGRATGNPHVTVKTEGNRTTKTARWNMAVKKVFKKSEDEQDAHFLKFVAYGRNAELVEKYVHKGSRLIVESRVDTYSYVKESITILVVEFVAEKIILLDAKSDEGLPVDENGFMTCPPELEAEMDNLFK